MHLCAAVRRLSGAYMGLIKSFSRTKIRILDWVKAQSVSVLGDVLWVEPLPISRDQRVRLCLLAHYSEDGNISDCLVSYVRSLVAAGCDVVLVSAAPSLDASAIDKLSRLGVGIILRRNVGYDFGSWRTAIRVFPGLAQKYKTVIFANDSVYGPFADIGVIIGEMESRNLDVWSLTSSVEFHPHLQSYFWAVSNNALCGGFFDFFWGQYYRYYSNRRRVIDCYELEFSRIASERFGLKVGAYVDVDKFDLTSLGIGRASKCNPTHHLALELLRDFNFPYVKRELLAKDPFGVGVDPALRDLLAKKNPGLWRQIVVDLEKQQAKYERSSL